MLISEHPPQAAEGALSEAPFSQSGNKPPQNSETSAWLSKHAPNLISCSPTSYDSKAAKNTEQGFFGDARRSAEQSDPLL